MLKKHQISAVDASYTSDNGCAMGIEITTSAYSETEIESKKIFTDLMGLTTKFIKV